MAHRKSPCLEAKKPGLILAFSFYPDFSQSFTKNKHFFKSKFVAPKNIAFTTTWHNITLDISFSFTIIVLFQYSFLGLCSFIR